jgi:homocysteine S-methyltransferase
MRHGSWSEAAELFPAGQHLVIDGAMATELERRGADLADPLWSARVLVETPALIEAVHYDYFVAGADIALTASYQATFAGFAARGLDANVARRLLESSVALACRARERFLAASPQRPGRRAPLVGASLGAYGAHRHDGSEYHGRYGVDAATIRDFHRRQLDVLAATPADFIAFETVPSREEAEAIVRLLEDYPGILAWISFACADGARVGHGEDFAECAALASASPAVRATGINCTAPQHVASLLERARQRASRPLFAYPNSGETWDATTCAWQGDAGLRPGELAGRWLQAGATMLGGCCRTTPADIRAITRAMRREATR